MRKKLFIISCALIVAIASITARQAPAQAQTDTIGVTLSPTKITDLPNKTADITFAVSKTNNRELGWYELWFELTAKNTQGGTVTVTAKSLTAQFASSQSAWSASASIKESNGTRIIILGQNQTTYRLNDGELGKLTITVTDPAIATLTLTNSNANFTGKLVVGSGTVPPVYKADPIAPVVLKFTTTTTNKSPVITGVSGPTELTAKTTGTWVVNAHDPDGTELVYIVDWGDGSMKTEERRARGSGSEKTEQKATLAHTYNKAGTYTIGITVLDIDGEQATSTASVRVKAAPAQISSIYPPSGPIGTIILIHGSNLQDDCASKTTDECSISVYFGSYRLDRTDSAFYPFYWNDSGISIAIPEGATGGAIRIVRTEKKSDGTTEAYDVTGPSFVLTKPSRGKPRITKISPTSGSGGTVLTIYGEYFNTKCEDNSIAGGGPCQASISIGKDTIAWNIGYGEQKFTPRKVSWDDNKIMVLIPNKDEMGVGMALKTGPVNIYRRENTYEGTESPSGQVVEEYRISGPVFTVTSSTTLNQSPTISGVSGPMSLKVNETGTWSVTANDPEGGALIYAVNWEEPVLGGPSMGVQQTATFTHSYSKSGTYTITFTVTDDKGASAKSTVSVNVKSADTPSVTVISPNGGEKWEIDSTYTIKWTQSGEIPPYLTINLLHYPDPAIFSTVIYEGNSNQTTFNWTIPNKTGDGIIKPGQYKIKVQRYTRGNDSDLIYDVSDAPFTITSSDEKASITRISPTSGPVGTVLTIYGRNLQDDCKGRDARVCQLTVSIGGYEIKRERFVELKVTWLQDRIMLVVPPKAQTGAVRIVREDGDKSYDITGPVFTVLSLGGYTIEPEPVTDSEGGSTAPATKTPTVTEIRETAQTLHSGELETLLAEIRELRNTIREQETKIKYLEKLTRGAQAISEKTQERLNAFIAYGVDDNTKRLGQGERAAVLHSYKYAFNKLPESEAEIADAILIANGRFPAQENEQAEERAKVEFKRIYLREPDENNPKDNAFIVVAAYGLRQRAENRNLKSEARGIAIFKSIYGHVPQTTEEWNVMQGITYSGASRKR